MIEYSRKRSDIKHPVEDAVNIYISRTKSTHDLMVEQENKIKDYLYRGSWSDKIGKGNLLYHGTGKQAFSFFDRKNNKKLRVCLKAKNMTGLNVVRNAC